MSRSALKKRKDSSYQRACMSNFLTNRPEGEMKPCPICQVYFSEEKLVQHASICGIDPSALFMSQTQTWTQTQTQTQETDGLNSRSSSSQMLSSRKESPLPQRGKLGDENEDEASYASSNREDLPPLKKRSTTTEPKSLKKSPASSSKGDLKRDHGKDNAFSKLMKAASQAAQHEKVAKSVSHFRLDVVQGALLCTFRHDEEEEEQHVSSCLTSWSEEVQFRQMLQTMTFDDGARTASDSASVEARDKRLDMRVMISTNLPCAEGPLAGLGEDAQGEGAGSAMRYFPVYKSMLQKAVRRREGDKAARLAARMMALSTTELFRRVPIICVEDAALHPEFSVVVWVMVALSKGYRAPLCLLESCLAFISDLANSPSRDIPLDCAPLSASLISRGIEDEDECLEDDGSPGPSRDLPLTPGGSTRGRDHTVCVSLRDLPPGPKRTLIMSLLFRASYGGMRFDVSMLESLARLWTLRFFYGPRYTVSQLDKLRLPTMKFNLHQSAIVSLMSDSAWGKQVVDAFSVHPGIASELKRELHSSVRGALTTRAGADDGDFPNEELLARALPLRKADLLEPGVDFHCDAGLCEHVLRTLRQSAPEKYERLEQMAKEATAGEEAPAPPSDYDAMVVLVKRCIWTFRSSTNGHKVWDGPAGESAEVAEAVEQHTKAELETKKRLAPAWGLMAATVASYCSNKVVQVAEKEGIGR